MLIAIRPGFRSCQIVVLKPCMRLNHRVECKQLEITVLVPQILVNANDLNLPTFVDFFTYTLDILSESKNW